MRKAKQQRLEANGWRVKAAENFLELTESEAALVDLKLRLRDALKARREKLKMSPAAVAKPPRSSQSRVRTRTSDEFGKADTLR